MILNLTTIEELEGILLKAEEFEEKNTNYGRSFGVSRKDCAYIIRARDSYKESIVLDGGYCLHGKKEDKNYACYRGDKKDKKLKKIFEEMQKTFF